MSAGMYFQAQAAKPAPARRAPRPHPTGGPAPAPNRRAPAKKPLLARHQVLEQGHPFSRTASSAPCSLTSHTHSSHTALSAAWA
jgi:hypothetical protein